jgi:signal transduction histidine kinase
MGLTDDETPIEGRIGSTVIATNGGGTGSGNRAEVLKTDELISMVSHDLRSPLSSIQLNIQSILHSRRSLPQWVRARLLRAEELIRHMAQLINDILIVERGHHRAPPRSEEPIDLLIFVR